MYFHWLVLITWPVFILIIYFRPEKYPLNYIYNIWDFKHFSIFLIPGSCILLWCHSYLFPTGIHCEYGTTLFTSVLYSVIEKRKTSLSCDCILVFLMTMTIPSLHCIVLFFWSRCIVFWHHCFITIHTFLCNRRLWKSILRLTERHTSIILEVIETIWLFYQRIFFPFGQKRKILENRSN